MKRSPAQKIGLRIAALFVLFTFAFTAICPQPVFARAGSKSNPWIMFGTSVVMTGLSLWGIKSMPVGYGLFRGLTQPFVQGAMYSGLKATGMDKSTAYWTAAIGSSLLYSAGCKQIRPDGSTVRPISAVFNGLKSGASTTAKDLARVGGKLIGREVVVAGTTSGVQALGMRYLEKDYKKKPWLQPLVDLVAVGAGAGASGMYAKAMNLELKITAKNGKKAREAAAATQGFSEVGDSVEVKKKDGSGINVEVVKPAPVGVAAGAVVGVAAGAAAGPPIAGLVDSGNPNKPIIIWNTEALGSPNGTIQVNIRDSNGNTQQVKYENTPENRKIVQQRLQTALSEPGATTTRVGGDGVKTTWVPADTRGTAIQSDLKKAIRPGATVRVDGETIEVTHANVKDVRKQVGSCQEGTKVVVIPPPKNGDGPRPKAKLFEVKQPGGSTLAKVTFGRSSAFPSYFVETQYLKPGGYASAFLQGVKALGPGFVVRQLTISSVYLLAQTLDKDFRSNRQIYNVVASGLGAGLGTLTDSMYYQRLFGSQGKNSLGTAFAYGLLNGGLSAGLAWGGQELAKQGVGFNAFQWSTATWGVSALAMSAASAIVPTQPVVDAAREEKAKVRDKIYEAMGRSIKGVDTNDDGVPDAPLNPHIGRWDLFKTSFYNANAMLFEDIFTFGRGYNNVMAGLGRDALYYAQISDFAYKMNEYGVWNAVQDYVGNKMHYHSVANLIGTGAIITNAIRNPDTVVQKADFNPPQKGSIIMGVVDPPARALFGKDGWKPWVLRKVLPDDIYNKLQDPLSSDKVKGKIDGALAIAGNELGVPVKDVGPVMLVVRDMLKSQGYPGAFKEFGEMVMSEEGPKIKAIKPPEVKAEEAVTEMNKKRGALQPYWKSGSPRGASQEQARYYSIPLLQNAPPSWGQRFMNWVKSE